MSVSNRSFTSKVARSPTPALAALAMLCRDQLGIEIDAIGARAALAGGDGDAAVAGAEVDQEFAGPQRSPGPACARPRPAGSAHRACRARTGCRRRSAAAPTDSMRQTAPRRCARRSTETRCMEAPGDAGRLPSIASGHVAQNRQDCKRRAVLFGSHGRRPQPVASVSDSDGRNRQQIRHRPAGPPGRGSALHHRARQLCRRHRAAAPVPRRAW